MQPKNTAAPEAGRCCILGEIYEKRGIDFVVIGFGQLTKFQFSGLFR